jgi:site-specific DNA recombinase
VRKKNKKSERPPVARVIGYARVSTTQQADEGSSIVAQRAQLEAYCSAFGYELVGVESDAGFSAGNIERLGLQTALARLQRNEADALLVVKLDRLTRNVVDLCTLVDEHFRGDKRLLSAHEHVDTSTASGRLVLNILTTVSQWEREAAAERTTAVMQHLKATGKFTGGFPPFGFSCDEDGNLIENAAEQIAISQARSMKTNGMSIRKIANLLPNPRTGKLFHPTQIARML